MKNEANAVTSSTEMVTISRAEYDVLLQKSEGYAELNQKLDWLMEQMRLAKKRVYGASSEQTKEELVGQLSLRLHPAGKLPETILPHPGSGWLGTAGAPCSPPHLRHQSGQRRQTAGWNHPLPCPQASGRPPRPLHLGDYRTLLCEKRYLPSGRDHGRI